MTKTVSVEAGETETVELKPDTGVNATTSVNFYTGDEVGAVEADVTINPLESAMIPEAQNEEAVSN